MAALRPLAIRAENPRPEGEAARSKSTLSMANQAHVSLTISHVVKPRVSAGSRTHLVGGYAPANPPDGVVVEPAVVPCVQNFIGCSWTTFAVPSLLRVELDT